MKKIAVSDLFEKSIYHNTKADDELITAIIEQGKKSTEGPGTRILKKIIIIGITIMIATVLYWIYAITSTNRFYTLDTTVSTTGSIQTGGYNTGWENELLDNIHTIVVDDINQ